MGGKTGALGRALSLAQGEFHRGFGPAALINSRTDEPDRSPVAVEEALQASADAAHAETYNALAILRDLLPGLDHLAIVAAEVGWPSSPEPDVLAAIIRLENAVAAENDADRMLAAFKQAFGSV